MKFTDYHMKNVVFIYLYLFSAETLLKDLQHFDNYLDYLKVDIESYIDGGLEDYVSILCKNI